MRISLQCYVQGRGGSFEGICVDLDIAVTGRSLQGTIDLLNDAIRTYVEDALAEDPATRDQLLHRRAPWHVRQRYRLMHLWHGLMHRGPNGDDLSASLGISCRA